MRKSQQDRLIRTDVRVAGSEEDTSGVKKTVRRRLLHSILGR